MKISIITATYNSAKSVGRALDSLYSQTFSNVEHVVVDGASTDNTLETIASHSFEQRVVLSEPDNGIYDALNKGLKLASGDIVGFLHSDDALAHDGVLQNVAEALVEGNLDGVYGDLRYSNAQGRIVRNWVSKPHSRIDVMLGWMPAHPTLFLTASCYRSLGLFDTRYRIAADYDFILRLLNGQNRHRIGYLNQQLVDMRVGGASNRSLKAIIRKSSEDYQIAKKHGLPAPLTVAAKNLRKLPQFFQ